MKYFVILVGSIIFFLGSIVMAYSLWNIDQTWVLKALMVYCTVVSGYILIKNIQNYSKVELDKNKLTVSKLLSTKTYDLDDLTSWSEKTNLYRVRYREVKLSFPNTSVTLMDHADPMNIDSLYHYLRTHYKNLRVQS